MVIVINEERRMEWILPLVVGVVVGTLGRLIMPGMRPAGFLVMIPIGLLGAYLGALLGLWTGWYAEVGTTRGLSASILGATLLVAVSRLILRPPSSS